MIAIPIPWFKFIEKNIKKRSVLRIIIDNRHGAVIYLFCHLISLG